MRTTLLFVPTALALLLLNISGCAAPILVPVDSQLVWAGNIDNATDIEGITWQQYGQIYLVDDQTGHVEGVTTVWPGRPRFTFDVPPHRRYRAYFEQQTPPTTVPAAVTHN